MNELKDALREFIRENFLFGDEVAFADDASLVEEGIVDSTGVLELITHIESTYDIEIDDEELVPENLDSISNLANFISSKQPVGV